jgi:chromosome segregation ATPase
MQNGAGLLALISLLLPIAAQAETIYICKDGSGKTFTSDRLIPECANRLVREMDRNGMVRREIPPPLTAEQKQLKQMEEERLKAEAAALEEKKQADRAMLARYRNESDIALARKRTLELVHDQVKRESGTLVAIEKDRRDVQLKIEQVGNKKPVLAVLQSKLSESDQSIAAIKTKIAAYQTEEAQINQRFDSTLKRYRELTGGVVTSSSAPVMAVPTATPVPKR